MLENASGKFINPSPASFNAAASQADWAKAPNAVASMLALPGTNTWPIVSATYILVPAKPTDPVKTGAALAFFDWSMKNGGKLATELGYLPLPPAAIQRVRAEWKGISGVNLPK